MQDLEYEEEMAEDEVPKTNRGVEIPDDAEYHHAMLSLNLAKKLVAEAMQKPETPTSRLAALTAALRQAAKEVERLDGLRHRERETADREAATQAMEEAQAYVAETIEAVDLHHLADCNIYYAKVNGAWRIYPPATVDMLFPRLGTKMLQLLLKPALKGTARSKYRVVYKVAEPADGELNILTYGVVEPIDQPYDMAFDLLIRSLSDGDDEKADYIERWLLARLNQIKAGSVTASYPALVFQNKGGGAGKDVFNQFLLPALVGKDAVLPNTSMSRVSSRFNAQFLGKLFVALNEAAMESTDYDALKRLLGAPMFEAEIKNGPIVMADNIAAYTIGGNEQYVVRLCANEVDRRFSIVRTDTKFRLVVADTLAKQGEVFATKADFLARLDGLVRDVIGSPEEAAKWLAHLQTKHGEIMTVEPFHSKDYADSALTQLPALDRLVDRTFGDDGVSAICDRQFALALRKAMLDEGKRGGQRGDRLRARLREMIASYGFVMTRIYDKNNNACDLYHRPDYNPENYNSQDWQTVGLDGKFEPKLKL